MILPSQSLKKHEGVQGRDAIPKLSSLTLGANSATRDLDERLLKRCVGNAPVPAHVPSSGNQGLQRSLVKKNITFYLGH